MKFSQAILAVCFIHVLFADDIGDIFKCYSSNIGVTDDALTSLEERLKTCPIDSACDDTFKRLQTNIDNFQACIKKFSGAVNKNKLAAFSGMVDAIDEINDHFGNLLNDLKVVDTNDESMKCIQEQLVNVVVPWTDLKACQESLTNLWEKW